MRKPNRYDAVLMDVVMPRRNGVSTAGEIMRLDPAVKIVFMGSDPTNRELVSWVENICFDDKPFFREQIRSQL